MTDVIITDSDSYYEGDILLKIPLGPAQNSSTPSALWNVEFTPSWQCGCFLSLLEKSRSSLRTTPPLSPPFAYQVRAQDFYHHTAGNFSAFRLYYSCGWRLCWSLPFRASALVPPSFLRGDSWQGVWYMCCFWGGERGSAQLC